MDGNVEGRRGCQPGYGSTPRKMLLKLAMGWEYLVDLVQRGLGERCFHVRSLQGSPAFETLGSLCQNHPVSAVDWLAGGNWSELPRHVTEEAPQQFRLQVLHGPVVVHPSCCLFFSLTDLPLYTRTANLKKRGAGRRRRRMRRGMNP